MKLIYFLALILVFIPLEAQNILPQTSSNQFLLKKSIDQARILQQSEVQLGVQELEVRIAAQKRQYITDSLKRSENDDLLKRIAELEIRATLLEKEQDQVQALRDEVTRDKEQRKQLNLMTIQSKYKQAMDFADLIHDESNDLAAVLSWGEAFGSVESLANPQKFPEFESGLSFLKENQRSRFKLPNIEILQTPLVNTVVSFISALGQKKDKEDASRGKLHSLQCLLDFTTQIERSMGFIELENNYLRKMNSSLTSRSDTVKENIIALVGKNPVSLVDLNVYVSKMNVGFIGDNSALIEHNILEVVSAFEEYKVMIDFSIATLEKVELALNNVSTGCLVGESKVVADDRIEGLKSKIIDAKTKMINSFYREVGHTNIYGLLYGYTLPAPMMARK